MHEAKLILNCEEILKKCFLLDFQQPQEHCDDINNIYFYTVFTGFDAFAKYLFNLQRVQAVAEVDSRSVVMEESQVFSDSDQKSSS